MKRSAQRKKPVTGTEGIVGEVGVAISNLKPDGEVKVHGEIWNAKSEHGEIKKGDEIVVVSVDNLKLMVRKKI